MTAALRFRIDSDTFRKNQNVNLEFVNSICKCTLNQDTSTPGIRLRSPIELTKGDYELVVTARASKAETFFLWVYDSNSNTRIGGTLHIGSETEKLALGFSLLQTTNVEIGVLAHRHEIGDSCEVEFVEIKQETPFERAVKPISMGPTKRQYSSTTQNIGKSLQIRKIVPLDAGMKSQLDPVHWMQLMSILKLLA